MLLSIKPWGWTLEIVLGKLREGWRRTESETKRTTIRRDMRALNGVKCNYDRLKKKKWRALI